MVFFLREMYRHNRWPIFHLSEVIYAASGAVSGTGIHNSVKWFYE